MSRSIDLVFDELPARDGWAEVMTVGLADSRGFELSIEGAAWRAFPCRDRLAVATIVPGWRWWDSGEVTEELIPPLSHAVRSVK